MVHIAWARQFEYNSHMIFVPGSAWIVDHCLPPVNTIYHEDEIPRGESRVSSYFVRG